MFHRSTFSGFILFHFQYMVRASLDAAQAAAAITFHHTDDFVPVLLPAVQAACNPQQEHNSQDNICCIHYLIVFTD
jgi:hypothetical protein